MISKPWNGKLMEELMEDVENHEEYEDNECDAEYGKQFLTVSEALVQSVRCGANTLQLAVHDAIKKLKLKSQLAGIRDTVKDLKIEEKP